MCIIHMLSFDDIHFPTEGWKAHQEDTDYRCWITPKAVAVQCWLWQIPGGGMRADITHPDKMRALFDEQNRVDNGAVLEFSIDTIKGLECVRVLNKTWIEPNGPNLGKRYCSNVFIPLMEGCIHFQAMAMELQVTGMREAAVDTMRITSGELDTSTLKAAKPQPPFGTEDYFKLVKNAPMRIHAADDEKYDASFPDHPLSQVRATIRQLEESFQVKPRLTNAAPFRL